MQSPAGLAFHAFGGPTPDKEKIAEIQLWWQNFVLDTNNPKAVFRKTLSDILKCNEQTLHGVKMRFSGMLCYEDFKLTHPLMEWPKYEADVLRMMNGESNLLCSMTPSAFFTSSGTTGKQKFIPTINQSSDPQNKCSRKYLEVSGLYQLLRITEYCTAQRSHPSSTPLQSALVINAQPVEYTQHGVPFGAVSAIFISNMVAEAYTTSVWRYVTEPSCHLLRDPEDLNYTVLLYSLQSNLDVINAAFVTSVLIWFRTLQSKWSQLVEDIREGYIGRDRLTDSASAECIMKINAKLKPNPMRADELEKIFKDATLTGFGGIAKRIWPNLSLVACMCGGSFKSYTLRAIFGINIWPGEKVSAYAFLPRACFLEFIPEEDIEHLDPRVLEINELEPGRCYELVVTTFSGLYRYRMGDIVRIEDKMNNMPIFEILYRRGSILNLFNEMTSEEMVRAALALTMKENKMNGCDLVDFTSRTDVSGSPPRYVIYVELLASDNSNLKIPWKNSLHLSLIDWSTFSEKLDENLQICNPIYGSKRAINRIAPLQLLLLKCGAFEKLRLSSCGQKGSVESDIASLDDVSKKVGSYTAIAQYKTPRLLKKLHQILLMDSFVLNVQALERPTVDELASEVNQSAVHIAVSSDASSRNVYDMLQNTLQRGIEDAEKLEGHKLSYGEMRNLFG